MVIEIVSECFIIIYVKVTTFIKVSLELQDYIRVGQVKVMIIPDIESVNYGRGVGYDIIEHEPPKEIGDISATKIRETKHFADGFHEGEWEKD